MLIFIAKKVLKSINYLCTTKETTSSLDIKVHFNNRTNKLDLHNTIQYLVDEKYITGDNMGEYWDEIKPTYKGKHYSDFNKAEFLDFLFRSMFVPILVSFFTTLITYFLFK